MSTTHDGSQATTDTYEPTAFSYSPDSGELILLDPEAWARLIDLCEYPPPPPPALVALMRGWTP